MSKKGTTSKPGTTSPLRIEGEVVFEPVVNGIRVTAKDSKQRMLWGFIASQKMISQTHCPVAIYDTLENHITQELIHCSLPANDIQDPMARAFEALDKLQETIDSLRKLITVQKVSNATIERAETIARISCDAQRLITLESIDNSASSDSKISQAPSSGGQTHIA